MCDRASKVHCQATQHYRAKTGGLALKLVGGGGGGGWVTYELLICGGGMFKSGNTGIR